ncbi:MAG TPA: hypothetical protein VF799_06105 [Geobacteraceae bacterium]
MYAKKSRYLKLPDETAMDARGASRTGKSLRIIPDVAGTFLHTIEEGDRLDHLAYKYYRQSPRWWRICDANPEFMSPQALLGKEPIVTSRIPISYHGEGNPPWHQVLKNLAGRVGVEKVEIVDDIRLVERETEIDGENHTYVGEHYDRAVIVSHNRLNISRKAIVHEIRSAGFNTGEPHDIGRVGKKIVIPPDAVG